MNTAKLLLLLSNQGPAFTRQVLAMFAAGEQGAIYDPSNISSLFQDRALTIPVTTSGDLVRGILDTSARGNHAIAVADANYATYMESGGQKYLVANGSSTAFVTSNINLTGSDRITLVAGISKVSDAGARLLLELSASASANAGTIYVAAPEATGASGNFTFKSRGSVNAAAAATGVIAAPATRILSCTGHISGDLTTISVNGGTQTTATGDQGTGNYGDYPLHLFSRAGSSLFFYGNFYRMVLNARPTGISDAERKIMERWVNMNTKVTLA